MSKIRHALLTFGAGALAVGISVGQASATPGSGTSRMELGHGTLVEDFDLKRFAVVDIGGMPTDWELELEGKSGLDVVAQLITFQPGGHSGWHSHPGPVFITVISGTMTFYESDDPTTCEPIVRQADQTYLDTGEHAHIARNETSAPATNLVVYLAPRGTPSSSLRIDEPDPGNCPF